MQSRSNFGSNSEAALLLPYCRTTTYPSLAMSSSGDAPPPAAATAPNSVPPAADTPSKKKAKAVPGVEGSPNAPHLADMLLQCVDCEEGTTVATSQATGRNELKRRCNGCGAFTRGLNRACEVPKEGGKKARPTEAETAEGALTRAEALKVQAHMKELEKNDPPGRAAFMRGEKRKRETMESGSRRTFTEPKGFVRTSTADKQIDDENDHFETCEEFCIRMMVLKRAPTELIAQNMFKAACEAPGANVMERRGEPCFG